MSSVFLLIWKNLLFLVFLIIKRSLPSNVKIWWTFLEIFSTVLRLLMEEKHFSQIDRIQLYRNFGVKKQGDIVIARVDRKTGLEALLYSTRIIPYYYFSINTLWGGLTLATLVILIILPCLSLIPLKILLIKIYNCKWYSTPPNASAYFRLL